MVTGYRHINIGASHEELIPGWLGITMWTGEYEGVDMIKTENGITIYNHTEVGGDVINHDIRKGLPLMDNSVDVIYASHFIQHLTFQEAINWFKECYRVLRGNGILRIVCPDMRVWIEKVYESSDIEFFESYKASINYDGWDNFIYNVRDKIKTPIQILNSMLFNWQHKWMWEYVSLKHELDLIGFDSIEKKSHLQSNFGKCEEIETRVSSDKAHQRNLESMFVECTAKQSNLL